MLPPSLVTPLYSPLKLRGDEGGLSLKLRVGNPPKNPEEPLTKMAEITVLKEASEIGLAVMLSDLIRQNLDQAPGKIKLFQSLKAKVLLEARDIAITVGLEFKQGGLTISEGHIIQPDLHIITDSATILDLCLLKIKFGLPYFFDLNGFKVLKKLITRQLIIKGWLRHFFTLVKLTELFSVMRGRNESIQGHG